MSQDPDKLRVVGRWMADLIDMTKQGRDPLTDHKIALYAEQLAEMFPTGAFTRGSLRAVIFEQEYFPAFDLVRARVRQWWNENVPTTGTLIEFAGGPRLNEMDQSWLTRYYKRRCDLVAANAHQSQFDNLDSLVRQQSPKAWQNITGVRDEVEPDVTPAERDAVARAVDRVVRGLAA